MLDLVLRAHEALNDLCGGQQTKSGGYNLGTTDSSLRDSLSVSISDGPVGEPGTFELLADPVG